MEIKRFFFLILIHKIAEAVRILHTRESEFYLYFIMRHSLYMMHDEARSKERRA